jgi:hypothetical protein
VDVKKFLFLLVIVVVVFVIWNRERLYLRDPLGFVTRDGVTEGGVQVYINYSNDVLLENDRAPMYLTLVQHGQRVGTPVGVRCLHYVICRTDAAISPMVFEENFSVESMSSRFVRFRGGDLRETVVKLY